MNSEINNYFTLFCARCGKRSLSDKTIEEIMPGEEIMNAFTLYYGNIFCRECWQEAKLNDSRSSTHTQ